MRPRRGSSSRPTRDEQARKRSDQTRHARDDRARLEQERQTRQADAIAAYARAEGQRAARTASTWRNDTARAGRAILGRLYREGRR